MRLIFFGDGLEGALVRGYRCERVAALPAVPELVSARLLEQADAVIIGRVGPDLLEPLARAIRATGWTHRKVVALVPPQGMLPPALLVDLVAQGKDEQEDAERVAATLGLPRRPNADTLFVAVGQNKGGSGKTTTATNLAGYLAMLGRRVLLIDANVDDGKVRQAVGLPAKTTLTVYHVLAEVGTTLGLTVATFQANTYGVDLAKRARESRAAEMGPLAVEGELRVLLAPAGVGEYQPATLEEVREMYITARSVYEVVVVDLGIDYQRNSLVPMAIQEADVIVLPCPPQVYALQDVDNSRVVVQMARGGRGAHGAVAAPVFVLPTMANPRLLDMYKDLGLPCLPPVMRNDEEAELLAQLGVPAVALNKSAIGRDYRKSFEELMRQIGRDEAGRRQKPAPGGGQ